MAIQIHRLVRLACKYLSITSEYTVSEPGGNQIRVDLVLFVNGIPLGVIEVKSSQVDASRA